MAVSGLVLLAVPRYVAVTAVTTGTAGQLLASVTEESFASGNQPILILTAAMGVMGMLALVTILSLKMRPRLRDALMWVGALSVLVASPFLVVLLPGAILLLLAAIGMIEGGENPVGVEA